MVASGDPDRGSAGQLQRLPAGQFRHDLPGRRQRAEALQLSLNVPAIRLLDAVGPQRLASRASAWPGSITCCPTAPRRACRSVLAASASDCAISPRSTPSSPIAAAPPLLGTGLPQSPRPQPPGREILDPAAAWHVGDILAGVAPPEAAMRQGFAYKTGTSFGFRDAWAIGFDGRHVLAVWAGRPDGSPVPGMTGTAERRPDPVRGIDTGRARAVPLPAAPAGALRSTRRRSAGDACAVHAPSRRARRHRRRAEPAPPIVFPPDGARVDLGAAGGPVAPLS